MKRKRARHRAKMPRRKPVRGKTVTTTTRSKVIRRTNPRRVVLYAHKPGMRRLRYLGRGKFGEHGRAVLFPNKALADGAARILRDLHPQALRGWTLQAA